MSDPELLPLSAEYISRNGAYLLDCGWRMLLLVGMQCSQDFIKDVLGVEQYGLITEPMVCIISEFLCGLIVVNTSQFSTMIFRLHCIGFESSFKTTVASHQKKTYFLHLQFPLLELSNPASERFHSFIEHLQDSRPHCAPLRVIR